MKLRIKHVSNTFMVDGTACYCVPVMVINFLESVGLVRSLIIQIKN